MHTRPLPTFNRIEALHKKYAPAEALFELVFTHCKIICDIARQLADRSGVNVDVDLVQTGSLLHDIGAYPLFDGDGLEIYTSNYITHGIRGEEILQKEGFAENICRFASHHTGAGLSKKQIIESNLPLPHNDYLAETPEEELTMYADKFHSKLDPPVFNSYKFYATYVTQFGSEAEASFVHFTEKFGKPDLRLLMSQYEHSLRD